MHETAGVGMTWRQWFERAIKHYGSAEAYYRVYREYHKPIYDAVCRYIPWAAHLCELGAGIGLSAMALVERGYVVTAVERDPEIRLYAHDVWGSRYGIAWWIGDELHLPPRPDWQCAGVTCLGILEHYEFAERHLLLKRLVEIAPVQVIAIPSPLGLELDPPNMGEQAIPQEQLVLECEGAGMTVVEHFGWGKVEGREGDVSLCVVGRRP